MFCIANWTDLNNVANFITFLNSISIKSWIHTEHKLRMNHKQKLFCSKLLSFQSYKRRTALHVVWRYSRILLQQRAVWTLAQKQGSHRVPQRPAPHHLCDWRHDTFRDALRLWSDPGHRGQMGGSDRWEELTSVINAAYYVV